MQDIAQLTEQTDTKLPRSGAGKVALVLEGGSYRGQFSAGVLDIFMEQNVYFDAAIGVSAGVLHGLSYKSRQLGRANRVNLAFCNDPRYVSARSLVTSGSLVGYDFLLNEVQDKLDPFDNEAYLANPMTLTATLTNIVFGTAEYHEITHPVLDVDIIQATTSLPLVTQPVQIGSSVYLDGGIADSVPIEHMLEDEGYDRVVVILTQERSYIKEPYEHVGPIRKRYHAYPYLVEAIETRHLRYNEQREHVWEYESQGRALVIAPQTSVAVGHVEHDPEKLLALYIQGRQEGARMVEAVKEFIGSV
ncbi:patatin family protein [Collinsella sp. zg1085]|uniref:patatin-like phospholipase family protein n=1 Tax=Collinsella sp. zg1085 TaxID=2844380 RepID=UPI001C0CE984|nr:patatin family protein [Collinsella sp. zg1085]QWT17434.1 patatin family protein [Collinsella sp. zg1085]